MEKRHHRLWHTAREYVTHWSVAGVVLAATGAAPEHWFAEMLHDVSLPHEALPPWLAHVDYRLVAVVAGLSIIVGDNLWRHHGYREPARADAPPAGLPNETPALPEKPSIAVLAFTNMSSDINQEYFSDGIAEDIITQLSLSNALFVIARNSSFTYKGHTISVEQVGRELGVRYVLEGSVRHDGQRVRINAQLIEADTGKHIWVGRFDRAVTDIFAVQDEIAEAVARAAEPTITRIEQERISRKPPENLDAWEAYQRGLWHFDKSDAANNALACEFFQQAVRLDPLFTGAHVELAISYLRSFAQYRSLPEQEAIDLAREQAELALSIDTGYADAHMAMGAVLFNSGEAAAAAIHFDQALSIDSNNVRARRYKALLLIFNGSPAEGRAALLDDMRLDPRSNELAMNRTRIVVSYYLEGDYVAAVGAAERCIAAHPRLYPAYYYLAASLGQLGRRQEAEVALHKAIHLSPQSFQFYVSKPPPWMRLQDHAQMLDGLRRAGWQESPNVGRFSCDP